MRAADGKGITYQYDDHSNKAKPRLTLCGLAQWATPQARDHKDAGSYEFPETLTGSPPLGRQAPRSGIGGPTSSPDGPTSPRLWATPNAADGTGGHHPSQVSAERGGNRTLNRNLQEMGYPLRLNPLFVEWLMGFPIGWSG